MTQEHEMLDGALQRKMSHSFLRCNQKISFVESFKKSFEFFIADTVVETCALPSFVKLPG